MNERLLDDIVQLEERVEELEGKLECIESMEARVDELDARTDLLQLVENTDQLEGEQRSVVLLQHLRRKVQRNDADRVLLTKDEAEQALSYPAIHRTTYYSDMRRCAELVGDEDICWYEPAAQSRIDEPIVVLNLEDGELPAKYRNRGE